MNRRTIILLVLTAMAGCRLAAQQEFNNKEVKDFLVSVQLLEPNDRCTYFAYELLTGELLKPSDKHGIYIVGAYVTDDVSHFMILKNKKKIFIKYIDIYQILETILASFEEKDCPFTDTQKLEYIKWVRYYSEVNMEMIGLNKLISR